MSCQEDEEPITPPIASDTIVVDSTVAIDLKGYVQKGPFINGTAITLSELDKKLVATGKNFTTQIADNRGSFSLKDIELESEFVQLQAEGFYFDEVKGEKSVAPLTLFALANVSEASSVNVNLLSHLERNRVVYLMQEEEQEFEPAKQQAQQEILTAFGIAADSLTYSEQLDISQEGDQNAMLLAISAILQGNNSVAELSELVANLITDLREDGTLNSEALQTKLKQQAQSLDLPQIRQNLEERYAEMGVEATIPNFEQYIDSDGDGILNKDEDDTPEDFAFETQIDVAINDTITSNAITLSGLKENGMTQVLIDSGNLILNGQLVADTIVRVKNNDQLQLQVISSSEYSRKRTTSLTVGTFVQHFTVITDDYIPNTFNFTPLTDVAVDSLYTSDTITISGLPYPTPITVTNGTLIKNNTTVSGDSIMVKNGDQLALQLQSSDKYAATSQATLDINGVMAAFETTTDDYAPDDFSFTSVEDATLDSIYTLETITLSDLPHPTPVSVSGGALWINGSKIPFGTEAFVSEGDQINIQVVSSSKYETATSVQLLLGSIQKSFQVVTQLDPWQLKADYPGTTIYHYAGFVVNNKLYVGLGEDPNDFENVHQENEFYEYDPFQDIWTKKADFLIPDTSFYYRTTFTDERYGYIGMGHNDSHSNLPGRNDFWRYDTDQDIWYRINNCPMKAEGSFSFTLRGDHYVGGGWNHDSGQVNNEMWRYDKATNRWNRIGNLPKKFTYVPHFSFEDKGIICLRTDNEPYLLKEVWQYDASINQWTQKNDYPKEYATSGGSTDNTYYTTIDSIGYTVIKQIGRPNQLVILKYLPTTDEWQEVTRKTTDHEFLGYNINWPLVTSLNNKIYILHRKKLWEYTPKE
jgi:hypothetical protein